MASTICRLVARACCLGALFTPIKFLSGAVATTTQTAKDNLVTNAGFEDGFAGWGLDAHGAEGTGTIDENVRHEGRRSLRFTNTTKQAPNVWYRAFRSI